MSAIHDHKTLVKNLLRQNLDTDSSLHAESIETHISNVLLAGEFAYKLKKPVNFGFLDFTQLSDRKYYCEEEIRLNSRLAPSLYLESIPVTGTLQNPSLNGTGPIIDYAVKMRRFDQSGMLNNLRLAGELSEQIIDQLADKIARFHQSIPCTESDEPYAKGDSVLKPMQQNFEQINALISTPGDRQSLATLSDWTQKQFTLLTTDLENRRQQGFIRECHGDMHLGNMLIENRQVIIFDGIEFNKDLRWIDVISELAFVCMDLDASAEYALSSRLLNRYLENTGDYAALRLLRFYQLYRAMVRAKVATLSLNEKGLDNEKKDSLQSQYQTYIQLGLQYIQPPAPRIYLMYGVSGSGKSTVSDELLQRLGAVRIRSDRERKRLFAENTHDNDKLNSGLYDPDITNKTYLHLLGLSEIIVGAGFTVIVDATFLKQEQRKPFHDMAHKKGVPVTVIQLEATLQNLERRVKIRQQDENNISDATLDVISQQLAEAEPPEANETCLLIHTDRNIDYERVVQDLEITIRTSLTVPGKVID
jgi:hypothetical protein